MTTPTISDLRRALELQEKIDRLTAELRSLLGVGAASSHAPARRGRKPKALTPPAEKKKRQMSPEARARIVAAQKKRWAAFKKKN